MGRSVSYASGSTAVAYRDVSWMSPDDLYDWDDMIEWVRSECAYIWEMTPCEVWVGREDKAVAENDWVYVGVSEYCGLMSIWLLPKEDAAHGESWASMRESKFLETFTELKKVATFSNGEAVFEKVKEMSDAA